MKVLACMKLKPQHDTDWQKKSKEDGLHFTSKAVYTNLYSG